MATGKFIRTDKNKNVITVHQYGTGQTIAKNGGNGSNQYQRKDSKGNKNENITFAIEQRGTGQPYRIAKLKRDYPVIAQRLAQGEFRSVREAERAAGGGRG